MNKLSPINIDPEIMSGAPVFRGTRVTIQTLFDVFESGKTINYFLDGYPSVSRNLVIDVLNITRKIFSNVKLLEIIDKDVIKKHSVS